ncbi:MAG TPA: N-methyl-D-aspartate receptor NMDAR2C subunit [Acidovorax sp.]|nr:N-methyl-D-aspartate receptor NMDAR2C subunit [Acidovorax sp.]
MFERSWHRCWSGLGAQGDGLPIMQSLLCAYAEPQRHYHTQQHLSECLALFERHGSLAEHPAEVEIALWFHDAVYDVKAGNNEARSAAWARQALDQACASAERVDRVEALIMATRHEVAPQGQDQYLLIDIDLAILGAPRSRFDEYEAQVRREYGWVPAIIYRRKRRDVLRGFAGRGHIYSTQALRDALEGSARENLAHSIKALGREVGLS